MNVKLKHLILPCNTGVKMGCMKWYTYDDNENGTVIRS